MTVSGDRPRPRRRRADAERSRAAILDAAIHLLRERPDAGMEAVARTAGVTRQTVYAHFSSRDELLAAAIERLTEDAVAAMDAANLDEGSATDALLRFLTAARKAYQANSFLFRAAPGAGSQGDEALHAPVADRLTRLFERGLAAGEFKAGLEARWLVAAVVALGHASGDETAAGRMTRTEAEAALRTSVLRLLGVEHAP
ncbi:TetR/AcrR family transcriptional regulator [Streptomyces sp. NPDC101160]|uniref:TetR/AcrR family transcriptional regulator n=1 Tax=Streptomyces sp. NPDC101160 TaxID=3366118 RepID=UPI0037F4ADD0